MRAAFLGLGQMGRPMALRLRAAGHSLTVYNRSAAAVQPLVEAGAQSASSPGEAARGQDVAITMLADDAAVESVAAPLYEALAPGAIHISMSTISPALARVLTEKHAARNQRFIAAPVFGRPPAAEAGKLWIAAAGARDAIDSVRPLFDAMSQGLFVVGEHPESAAVVKLAGNFLIASLIESLGEAFALGRKSGADTAVFLEIVKALFPSPIIAGYATAIAERKFSPPGFTMRLGHKDLKLVTGAAEAAQVPMPLASLLKDRFLQGMATGMSDLDWSAAAQLIARAAGLD